MRPEHEFDISIDGGGEVPTASALSAATLSEADRLVEMEPFSTSPVLARLLQFLAQRSTASRKPISQWEVAFDGLNRQPSDDHTDDSYPRVQVSRLRKALELVYGRTMTRMPPPLGLYLYVKKGDYRIYLAPLEEAYPDLHHAEAVDAQLAAAAPVPVERPVADDVHEPAPELPRPAKLYFALAAMALLNLVLAACLALSLTDRL